MSWYNSYKSLCLWPHAGQVSADSDSAEDIAEDPDAAVDEEEDEEEVPVEQDQMQPLVCMFSLCSCISNHRLTC